MDVIDELITHCEAWEPWARVMGNVCAGDAAQALRNLRAELAVTKSDLAVSVGHLSRLAEAYGCEDFTAAVDAAIATKESAQ